MQTTVKRVDCQTAIEVNDVVRTVFALLPAKFTTITRELKVVFRKLDTRASGDFFELILLDVDTTRQRRQRQTIGNFKLLAF